MKDKQRVLALMLSLMIIVTYMPAVAFAESEEQADVSKIYHGTVKDLAGPDELLDSFMEKQIEAPSAGRRAKAAGNNRRGTLTEDEKAAYDAFHC